MLPEAYCVHETPARLRAKIPAARGDESFFSHLRQELSRCPQIGSVSVNPVTASVLIQGADLATVTRYAEERGLFRLERQRRPPSDVTGTTLATYRRLNRGVKRLSGGELDLASGAFSALFVTGLYQLARGRFRSPPWYTAFWYALSIFLSNREKK